MKHRGDNAPQSFSVEEQPNKPGYVLARFYENVAPFSETRDEVTITGYEYDEYFLELKEYNGIQADIEANVAGYLAQAKAQYDQDAYPDSRIAEQQAIINALLGG